MEREKRYFKRFSLLTDLIILSLGTERMSSVILKCKMSRLRRRSIILRAASCELKLAVKLLYVAWWREKRWPSSIKSERFYNSNLKTQNFTPAAQQQWYQPHVTSILTCNRYLVKEKDGSIAQQIRVILMIPWVQSVKCGACSAAI